MKKLFLLLLTLIAFSCENDAIVYNKTTSTVTVTTVAGVTTASLFIQNGGYNNGDPATFNFPSCIATAPDGTCYVFGDYEPVIRKITPAGYTTWFSGNEKFTSPSYYYGFANGSPRRAMYNNPKGLFYSNGFVLMADTHNFRIRQIDGLGWAKTVAGSGTIGYADGPANTAQFKSPNAVCEDTQGIIYVADEHRIRRIDLFGNVTTISGSIQGNATGTLLTARYRNIEGITIDGDILYVSDSGNNCVKKINLSTGIVTLVDIPNLITPSGIVVANGSLFVGSRYGNVVFKINDFGIETIPGFNQPEQLSKDLQGNVYVADRNNLKIKKIININ